MFLSTFAVLPVILPWRISRLSPWTSPATRHKIEPKIPEPAGILPVPVFLLAKCIAPHSMKGEGEPKWPNEFISVPATRWKTNTPGAIPMSMSSARGSPRRRPPPCAAAAWRCSWQNLEPAWPKDALNPTLLGRTSTIASTPMPSTERSPAPGCSALPCPERGTTPAGRSSAPWRR